MSKAFSAFYDYLLPELPGCTPKTLDLHLLLVARQVCDKAGCWQESLSPITSEAGRTCYSLAAPLGKTEVCRVLRLTWGNRLQWTTSVLGTEAKEQARFAVGKPPFSVNSAGDSITLTEQPDGQIQIDATLRPSLAATALPDLLLNRHIETVRVGVLSRLMRMGGKPWSNSALAADYGSEFNAHLNHGAVTAARGNTRGPLRSGRTSI